MAQTHGKYLRALRVALAAIGLGGCSMDSATAPTAPALPSAPAPALLSDLFRKNALERDGVLRKDITVSVVIDANGGRIEIPDAGFTLVVPRGAVQKRTQFSVTAVKGNLVAYEFEPHGTQFRVPLVATQNLRVTDYRGLSLNLLTAGYFADRSQIDLSSGTVLVSELIQGVALPLTKEFHWPIRHFSGYIVAY